MFHDFALARRVEEAEVALTRGVVEAVIAAGHAPRAFLRKHGSAVAAYIRPNSPMNKLIGLGLSGSLDEAELEKVEALMRACNEPTRIELSAIAPRALETQLLDRGYRRLGWENVLVRSLCRGVESFTTNVEIERVDRESMALWQRTTIDASVQSDRTGELVDQFSHETIEQAVNDFCHASEFERYLARLNGVAVGAAGMLIRDRIALLGGSATLSPYRLRGVQTALIAARLSLARERGAEHAAVTTAPGSRSETNLTKAGFSVAYARAILVRG